MKKEYEFDKKQVERDLFATYKVGNLKGRRTRTFLRAMSRKIEHGYRIGLRDATDGKPMIPEEAIPAADSAMGVDLQHRAYVAYREGYAAGSKERKEA